MESEGSVTLSKEVQEGYVAAAPGVGSTSEVAHDVVWAALGRRLLAGGVASTELDGWLAEVAAGVVAGSKSTGTALWHAARGAVAGSLRACVGHGVAPTDVLALACSALVRAADAAGADFGAAAKGGVEGAIEVAETLGLDESEAASAAATGAWRAAKGLRPSAAVRVERIVTPAVSGVLVRLRE